MCSMTTAADERELSGQHRWMHLQSAEDARLRHASGDLFVPQPNERKRTACDQMAAMPALLHEWMEHARDSCDGEPNR